MVTYDIGFAKKQRREGQGVGGVLECPRNYETDLEAYEWAERFIDNQKDDWIKFDVVIIKKFGYGELFWGSYDEFAEHMKTIRNNQ
jgi:hypothetical protein